MLTLSRNEKREWMHRSGGRLGRCIACHLMCCNIVLFIVLRSRAHKVNTRLAWFGRKFLRRKDRRRKGEERRSFWFLDFFIDSVMCGSHLAQSERKRWPLTTQKSKLPELTTHFFSISRQLNNKTIKHATAETKISGRRFADRIVAVEIE